MTSYQINLTIDKYFEVLMDKSIQEKDVKDFYEKNGFLYIVLENETVIKEQIKNFYN